MSSQKQKNRRVEGGHPSPLWQQQQAQLTYRVPVLGLLIWGWGCRLRSRLEFYLPQVQLLIIMVLMRSRCSWVKMEEAGRWLGERGVAYPERTYMEVLSRDSQIPPLTTPNTPAPHVLITTQQVPLVKTENCLPQRFSEPLLTLAMLKGYWNITV